MFHATAPGRDFTTARNTATRGTVGQPAPAIRPNTYWSCSAPDCGIEISRGDAAARWRRLPIHRLVVALGRQRECPFGQPAGAAAVRGVHQRPDVAQPALPRKHHRQPLGSTWRLRRVDQHYARVGSPGLECRDFLFPALACARLACNEHQGRCARKLLRRGTRPPSSGFAPHQTPSRAIASRSRETLLRQRPANRRAKSWHAWHQPARSSPQQSQRPIRIASMLESASGSDLSQAYPPVRAGRPQIRHGNPCLLTAAGADVHTQLRQTMLLE